jgi:NAD(P)-dependent dehydrogenase (short-subunit alcohol dehydrogenase family)
MCGVMILGADVEITTAIARRFGRAGMPVGIVVRTARDLNAIRNILSRDGVPSYGATADGDDEMSLLAAVDEVMAELGVPQTAVYSPDPTPSSKLAQLAPHVQVEARSISILGVLTTAWRLAPLMARRGGGTIVFSGDTSDAVPVDASSGKTGMRALFRQLAREYRPLGVRLADVTSSGLLSSGNALDPSRIAEACWCLHQQAQSGVDGVSRCDGGRRRTGSQPRPSAQRGRQPG